MVLFFRKLPLTIKLSIIGIIPVLFLFYFAIVIFQEKSQKTELIGKYIEHVQQSKNVGELISKLGIERRVSYQFTLKLQTHQDVLQQRAKTDSIINILKKSNDLALFDFSAYTFLDKLEETRKQIDTVKNYGTYPIIQFYTNAIYRINTLNATAPPTNLFLEPVYQDLIAQKILSQLITFLGIIRTNVYDVLYTKEHMYETLFGTLGVYQVYNTYEKEFLIKASPASVQLYKNNRKSSDYHLTMAYLDTLFTTFKFDSTYAPAEWWDVSTGGINILKRQQENLWKSVDNRMKDIYQHEKNLKNATLIFLLFSILFVIVFVTYFINHITKLLQEIKIAARKISKGETGLNLNNMPTGIIGSLAKSIIQIDKNNLMLANAANEIGKGNFNVLVKPRSNEDLLGISIKKMKLDLRTFTSQKDKIQKETAELVHRRDEFFSIASHELKTPITSLKAYTQLMLMDADSLADAEHALMLSKMDIQIDKLTSLITVLLDTSKVQEGKLDYNKKPFKIRGLIDEIVERTRPTSPHQQIIFIADSNATIIGDRDRIGQVVSNLLVNATKYATNSKKIIVGLKQIGEKVVCSVQDFGNGIAEVEHNKIFERFYRVLGNNLHTYPGLGLGLYISKGIIENHSGQIWVQSELGKGSTFYFELPVSES
jgi:signal transduction histidine kinase